MQQGTTMLAIAFLLGPLLLSWQMGQLSFFRKVRYIAGSMSYSTAGPGEGGICCSGGSGAGCSTAA